MVEVRAIVCLNSPKTLDKFTIFLRALRIPVKKVLSLIMLIFCNLKIKFLKRLLNSSAASANSLNPSISILRSICLVSLAILAAASNRFL